MTKGFHPSYYTPPLKPSSACSAHAPPPPCVLSKVSLPCPAFLGARAFARLVRIRRTRTHSDHSPKGDTLMKKLALAGLGHLQRIARRHHRFRRSRERLQDRLQPRDRVQPGRRHLRQHQGPSLQPQCLRRHRLALRRSSLWSSGRARLRRQRLDLPQQPGRTRL